MNVALRKPMTAAEFLAWEERQEARYEFDGFAPVAMTGGTRNHAALQSNLISALGSRLRGKPCQAFGSELKIAVGGAYRYPDAMILCTPGSGSATVVDDPVVVFEILSDSTATTDRITKNTEYRNTPSIQRYVIIEQTGIGAEVFTRDGQDWAGRVQGPGSVLHIPEAGIEVPLDELYEGLGFSA
jgi:Uma2 family endonuclease